MHTQHKRDNQTAVSTKVAVNKWIEPRQPIATITGFALGIFKGEIFTQDTLVINAGANVDAQVEADIVIISGNVSGNIFARRRVIMHPPAIFKGTVTSPSLRIDEGVMFEGASYMPKT